MDYSSVSCCFKLISERGKKFPLFFVKKFGNIILYYYLCIVYLKQHIMKSAKLLSALNELGKISEKYPTINYGGCGAFALYVSDELNKRNIKHDITWIGNTFGNSSMKSEIRKIFKNNSYVNLQDFNENGIYLSHAMIKIKNTFVDAEGVFKGFGNTNWSYREVLATIKTDELRMLVEDEKGWNDSFNRKNMPKLKKDIEKIMKKLDE